MTNRIEVYGLIGQHYRTNFNNFVAKLQHTLGGKHNAEDTVQEAYTRALKYWKSFDLAEASLDQWISGILGNCIKDFRRDSALNGLVQEDLAAMPEPPRFDITDLIMANELKSTINFLPSIMRFVLWLYLIDGYTSREISDLTDFSPEAVRKTVSRFKENYLAA